jgi:hypothetical protein
MTRFVIITPLNVYPALAGKTAEMGFFETI